jgi:putative hydroxymethylpyrimidine transport system substrate-binding protein
MLPRSAYGCGLLTLALAAVLLATGCGGESGGAETAETHPEAHKQLRKLNVVLDGWEGPETAGILMAKENGYFAEAGLEVATVVPASPDRSIEYVLNGTADLGVVQEPQVVLAAAKVAPNEVQPIVIIDSLIPQPTAAMIWTKKSGIHDVSDLKGKSIAYPGLPYQHKFLENLLAHEGLAPGDVTIEDVGYKLVQSLARGRADAIFGGSANLEGIELKSRGVQPVVTGVQNLGIPPYDELVLIAPSGPLLGGTQLFRDFTSALARGTAAAVKEPEEVLSALERATKANPSTSPKALRAQIKATLPLLSKNGYVNQARIERLVNWMHKEGMLQRKVGVATLSTNYYR